MKIHKLVLSLMPLCLVLTSFAVYADTRYISSAKAKVLKEPDFKAPILLELEKGNQVDVLKTQGVWLNVQAQDKTGWISKFLVKETLPLEKVTVLPGDDETQLKDVRRRTSAITTAAAARGLAAAEDQSDDKYSDNLDGVNYMESFRISSQDLQKFEQPLTGGIQ